MTNSSVVKNGLLSGMVLTWGTGVIVVPLTFFAASFRQHFEAGLSHELYWAFVASVIAMAAHKIESFLTGEFDQCPVYLTTGNSLKGEVRKGVFVGFVPTFVGMTFVVMLALYGPPWPLVICVVWLAQGLHELHHTAKSLSRRSLYPGSITSLVFVGIMAGFFYPLWFEQVVGSGPWLYVYWLAIPVVFVAFYLEDRWWTSRVPESIWRPKLTPQVAQ